MDDGPAGPPPPSGAEPSSSPPPSGGEPPLGRYRALQVISILLIVGGLLTVIVVFALSAELLLSADATDPQSMGGAIGALVGIVIGVLATVTGLIMNAVRAVIVRKALPASRYRGPSIIVLLLIATVISSLGVLAAVSDLLALQSGGELSVGGSLLVLTITQIGLVVTAALFVAAPRALEGVRVLPEHGGLRSVLLGLGLALPAWIGATLLGVIIERILALFGHQPEAGIVDMAVMRIDPTVLVIALVIVAPVAEEIFFRGVAYHAWLREYGPRVALFGSAALFAVIHANTQSLNALIGSVASVVPILGLGVVLALVMRATGSLAASMALHAGFNAVSVTIALLVRAGVLDILLPT